MQGNERDPERREDKLRRYINPLFDYDKKDETLYQQNDAEQDENEWKQLKGINLHRGPVRNGNAEICPHEKHEFLFTVAGASYDPQANALFLMLNTPSLAAIPESDEAPDELCRQWRELFNRQDYVLAVVGLERFEYGNKFYDVLALLNTHS